MSKSVSYQTTLCIIVSLILQPDSSTRGGEVFRLPDNPYALDEQSSCGPLCLSFVDGYFSGSCQHEQVLELCPPGPFGTSLEQVRAAANELDYHTVAFTEATISQLKRLRFPTILHLDNGTNGGHFVILLEWNENRGTFRGFNPPNYYGDLDPNWVGDRMSGLGLVVSDVPLPPIDHLLNPRFDIQTWLAMAVFLFLVTLLILPIMKTCFKKVSALNARLAACFLLTIPLLASCSEQTVAPPAEDISSDSVNGYQVDFGTILAGAELQHTFEVINSSDQSFKVIRIEKSCACQAVAVAVDREILPGSSTKISVKIPTRGKEGRLVQRIDVITTSKVPDLATVELIVRANVEARIKAIPSQIMFGNIEPVQPANCKLRVRVNEPNLIQQFQTATVINNPHLTVRLCGQTQGLLTFDVELDPECPAGHIIGKIRLQFDDPQVSELLVPVVGRKLGHLKAIPQVLRVRRSSPFPQSYNLRVVSRTGKTFSITNVDCPSGIKVHWDKACRSSSSFDLRVELGNNSIPKPSSRLVIRTNQDDQARVTVLIIVTDG